MSCNKVRKNQAWLHRGVPAKDSPQYRQAYGQRSLLPSLHRNLMPNESLRSVHLQSVQFVRFK